jgi:CcmD family protein
VKELGYLVVAYVLTGAAIGAYLLSLVRRQRSLERRLRQTLEQTESLPPSRAGEGMSHG